MTSQRHFDTYFEFDESNVTETDCKISELEVYKSIDQSRKDGTNYQHDKGIK